MSREPDGSDAGRRPLEGIRVIDIATLVAGPLIATFLADFGADVVKVEHPRGDPLRGLGYQKDGMGLWWKMANRGKRAVTLDLHSEEAQELLRRLVADADVLIENFRPGTLERWGLSWDVLREVNPRLIFVRVTGYGQTGPYRDKPGFGTLAEAFSGFAHITGQADGPPTLAPFGLGDGIAALAGTYATAMALYHRDMVSHRGQMIDLAIYEPIFHILGPQAVVYQQLGVIQERMGNRSRNNAPRNIFKTKDGHWIALSTASPSTFVRLMRLIGRDDLADDRSLVDSGAERVRRADELDAAVATYARTLDLEEILAEFERVGAAVGPVYDIAQIVEDPHYRARSSLTSVPDPDLGDVLMPGVFPVLSDTPGFVESVGPRLGEHSDEIYQSLGLSADDLRRLRTARVI